MFDSLVFRVKPKVEAPDFYLWFGMALPHFIAVDRIFPLTLVPNKARGGVVRLTGDPEFFVAPGAGEPICTVFETV